MNTFKVLTILFLITLVYTRAAIGIDFGSEFIKVGLVKAGTPIDLILNEASKRKSDNMVGVLGKEKLLSGNAKSKVRSNR